MGFKNIGIFVNKAKKTAFRLGCELVRCCQLYGLSVSMLPQDAEFLAQESAGLPLCEMRQWAHLMVSLGGDGTLLEAARLFAPAGIPILGINLGHLGFLTAGEPDGIGEMVLNVIEGHFTVDERRLVNARVVRAGSEVCNSMAVNDVVIAKGAFSHIRVTCHVNDQYLATYPGDGVIIASATGSTAYTLSAGGPIISPSLECLVITPICAHVFGSRSVVIAANETIKAVVTHGKEEILLAADGQQMYPIRLEDEIYVTLAEETVKFIRLPGQEFFRAVQTRLQDSCFKPPID